MRAAAGGGTCGSDGTVAEREAAPPIVASVTMIADDAVWVEKTASFLRGECFEVVLDARGDTAFDHRARSGDAAIIDLDLAARPGTAVCIAWRARTSAPVLALSRSADQSTLDAAFAAGADHFAPRDISPRQLVAHLRALLRRAPPSRRAALLPGGIVPVALDEEYRGAVVWGAKVPLGDQEFLVLKLLVARRGRIVTRAELISALFPGAPRASTGRSLDSVVRRLREKLEAADPERRIVTVRGVGLRFDPEPQPGTSA